MKQFVITAVLVFGFMTMVASNLDKWLRPPVIPVTPVTPPLDPRKPHPENPNDSVISIVGKRPVPRDAVYDSKKK